jgi:hypothetical protein
MPKFEVPPLGERIPPEVAEELKRIKREQGLTAKEGLKESGKKEGQKEEKIPPERREKGEKALEGFERIRGLEKQIREKEKLLKLLRKEGKTPESPEVQEIQASIAELQREREKIIQENPDAGFLWELSKEMESAIREKAQKERFKNVLAALAQNPDLNILHLLGALNLAKKIGLVKEVPEEDLTQERLSESRIKIGKRVFLPTGPDVKEEFEKLKRLEELTYKVDEERKKRMEEAEKRANTPVETLFQLEVPPGRIAVLEVNFPWRIGKKKAFLRGAVVFESIQGKNGKVYWKVAEVIGLHRLVEEGTIFSLGLEDAPEELREIIQEAIKRAKEQKETKT